MIRGLCASNRIVAIVSKSYLSPNSGDLVTSAKLYAARNINISSTPVGRVRTKKHASTAKRIATASMPTTDSGPAIIEKRLSRTTATAPIVVLAVAKTPLSFLCSTTRTMTVLSTGVGQNSAAHQWSCGQSSTAIRPYFKCFATIATVRRAFAAIARIANSSFEVFAGERSISLFLGSEF